MQRLRGFIHRALSSTGLWPSASQSAAVVDELDAPQAYRLWAPTYSAESATSFLDEEVAREMLRGLPHTSLLDAGCGIGRGHRRCKVNALCFRPFRHGVVSAGVGASP